jgi:hypothetical protein
VVIVGGALATLIYMRISAWMFLVAAGLAGLAIQNLLARFIVLFGAHLNQGGNIQAMFFVLTGVSTLSWIAVVIGLFSVFRDVARRLQFHEEREQARAC